MEKEVISPKAVRQVFTDYIAEYKAHPFWATVMFFAPAIGTILVFFVPTLIVAQLLNIFSATGTISLNGTWPWIVAFGVLWMLGELLWRLGFHYLMKLESRGIYHLNHIAFERLSERDYDFYASNFVGSLTKKALAFSRSFEIFTDTMTFNVVNSVFPIIFACIILWFYSPWIALTLIAWIIVGISAAIPIIRRRSKLVALRHEASSRVAGRLSDVVTNAMGVKSFAKEKEELGEYDKDLEDLAQKYKAAGDFQNRRFDMVIAPLYVMANVCGLIAAVFFSGKLNLSAATIMVVFSYYAQTTRIFWQTNQVYRQFESSISEASEFTQLFLDEPAIKDVPDAQALVVTVGDIRFSSLNFKYDGVNSESTDLFLRDFNLEIPGKQKVGLVGPSGGGKTTITKLLLRFVDAQSGSILIDGQEIGKVTQASLREAIGYVPQDPLLFHRSLFENIAYGRTGATKKDVVRVAKIAHADEFIDTLSVGYETLVGERGIKLSGGQRQRIAIARALLKNAPILILDEATSSLDSESEKYIQEGLWELMKDKTALVIAHRLSTIKHLDRIIVLDNGKIVQDGPHEKLVREKGIYAKLWEHQSGGFLEE